MLCLAPCQGHQIRCRCDNVCIQCSWILNSWIRCSWIQYSWIQWSWIQCSWSMKYYALHLAKATRSSVGVTMYASNVITGLREIAHRGRILSHDILSKFVCLFNFGHSTILFEKIHTWLWEIIYDIQFTFIDGTTFWLNMEPIEHCLWASTQSSARHCLLTKQMYSILLSTFNFSRDLPHLFQSSSKLHRNCGIRWSKCSHFRVEDLLWDWKQEVLSIGSFWISQDFLQLLCLQLPHLDQERYGHMIVAQIVIDFEPGPKQAWPFDYGSDRDWLWEFWTWTRAGMASWLWLPRLWRIFPSPVVLTFARQDRLEQLLKG